VQHACNMLVQLANARGGHDNITVQMARVIEVGAKGPMTIPGGPSPLSRSPEAVQMTAPGAQPTHPGTRAGPVTMQAMPAWTPAGPTAMTDAGTEIMPAGHRPGQQPGPTIPEHPPVSQQWTSGQYNGPQPSQRPAKPFPTNPGAQPTQPHSLASYRIEATGPMSLPLPPPAGYAPAGNTQGPMSSPMRYGAMPPSMSPMSSPSKGGIVFVIIGFSTMIAIVILIVLWAILR
jgi:PPM family protein phosphatase